MSQFTYIALLWRQGALGFVGELDNSVDWEVADISKGAFAKVVKNFSVLRIHLKQIIAELPVLSCYFLGTDISYSQLAEVVAVEDELTVEGNVISWYVFSIFMEQKWLGFLKYNNV